MKTRSAKQKPKRGKEKEGMESMTREDLSVLLQDRVFVDYFNVFLSLPIFSQRVIYLFGEKDFEFDPPITRTKYVLDRSALIKWILTERVPLFLKSELYVEYLFCKELLSTKLFFTASARKLEYGEFRHREDTMLLEEAIGHAVGMCRLRKYLDDTPGEQVFKFWMDVERLKRIPKWDMESRWLLFRELQLKYFKADALSSVRNSEAWDIFSDGSSAFGEQPYRPNSPDGAPDCLPVSMSASALENFVSQTIERPAEAKINDAPFCELQELVLAVIKDYWLQKYLLHCRAIQIKQLRNMDHKDKGIAIRSKTDLAVLKDVKNIDKALTLLQGASEKKNSKVKKRKGQLTWNAMFPENRVDDTYLIPSDEVITIHDDGSVSMELVHTEEFERMLQKYLTVSSSDDEVSPKPSTTPDHPESSRSSSRSSRRSSAASSNPGSANKRPPRRQSIDLMKRIALAEAKKQQPNSKTTQSTKTKLDLFEQLLNVYMVEVVPDAAKSTERPQSCPARPLPNDKQEKDGKGRKKKARPKKPDRQTLKKQLIKEEEMKNLPTISENETLPNVAHAAQISSAPAALTSISRTHPTAAVTKPDHQYKNLSVGYYRHDHAQYVLAIAADRLGGTPFQNFLFERKFPAFSWQTMNLWHTIQEYLATKDGHGNNVGSYLRFRRAKAMLMRYLSGVGDRKLHCLPPGLNKLLFQVIPDGGGEDLLRDAQDCICEYVRTIWNKYRKYDSNLFLESVLAKKRKRGSISRELPSLRVGSVPPYFDRQSRHPSIASVDSVDKLTEESVKTAPQNKKQEEMPEDIPGLLSERRATRALQLTVEISEFYDDGLPMDELSISDIDFDIDNPYGSLNVPPPIIVKRPDLEEELERQRKLARMRAARIAALEQEEQSGREKSKIVIEDDTPSYMKPFKRGGTLYHRSSRPSRFSEIMKDPIQLEFLRRYLAYKMVDHPLQFYLAVEELKKTKDPKARQQKINLIIRKYFKTNGTDDLECSADVIKEIPRMEKVTTAMLISAQSCVQRSIEENRFQEYLETFPECEENNTVQDAMRILADGGKRQWGKQRTKSLWVNFISMVVRFRRGILDHETSIMFEDFIKEECKKEIEKQRNSGQPWTFGMPVKKVIRGRVVDVTRLLSDLRFSAEAERFRSLCDDASSAANEGNYSRHDQLMLEKKAKMIMDCYIESDLPPKIQVNISQDTAEQIVDMFNNNMVERGLFHFATVSIFPTMVFYWKRFQKYRWINLLSGPKRLDPVADEYTPDYSNLTHLKTKRVFAHHADDDHPRIMFTLCNGPRLIIPCSREHSRRPTVFQVGRDSVFYANPLLGGQPPSQITPSFIATLSPSQQSLFDKQMSNVQGARLNMDDHLTVLRRMSIRKQSIRRPSLMQTVREDGKLPRLGSRRRPGGVQFGDQSDTGNKQSEHVILPPITLPLPE